MYTFRCFIHVRKSKTIRKTSIKVVIGELHSIKYAGNSYNIFKICHEGVKAAKNLSDETYANVLALPSSAPLQIQSAEKE